MNSINVGLVGITGYTGMELARILSHHPVFHLNMACSRAEAGKRLGEFYPFLEGLPGSDTIISVYTPEEAKDKCDIVFLAVPSGTAMLMAPELLEVGCKVVDLSADFRIHDANVYTQWYKIEHNSQELLPKAVYGIPELYSAQIKKTSLVANPGCYPTSVILGLFAALKNDLINTDDIVVDSKSGVTGAGRKASVPILFAEVAENFRAYNLPSHRHIPEIEQELSLIAKKEICISFSTHLLPINRGILSTIYVKLKDIDMDLDYIHNIYTKEWENYPWVRILPKNTLPETRYVHGSMYCDIGLVVDKRTKRLVIVSVIDNLCRGASGQAIANANLMSGQDVQSGFEKLSPIA